MRDARDTYNVDVPPWGEDEQRIYASGYEDGIAVIRSLLSEDVHDAALLVMVDNSAYGMDDIADAMDAAVMRILDEFDKKDRPFPWLPRDTPSHEEADANRQKQSGWATWRYVEGGFGVFVNGHPYQEYSAEGEAAAFTRGWNQCKRHIEQQRASPRHEEAT